MHIKQGVGTLLKTALRFVVGKIGYLVIRRRTGVDRVRMNGPDTAKKGLKQQLGNAKRRGIARHSDRRIRRDQ